MAGMVKINIKEKPRTITGGKFTQIVDMDALPVPMLYQCDRCGNTQEIVPPKYYEDPSLIEVLKTLVLTIPRSLCTIKDSTNAFDFFQCVNESADKSELAITDSLHAWLIDTVKKHGPTGMLGVNAVMIVKALDNINKGPSGNEGKGG